MGFTNLNPNKNKYFAVPEELKGYKNWVCWQSYPDPKSHSGISKKPINPRTGGFAMPNNSDTWSDFETAVRESAKYSGSQIHRFSVLTLTICRMTFRTTKTAELTT